MAVPGSNVINASSTSNPGVASLGLFETTTVQPGPVGTLRELADGRRFRLGYAYTSCTANKLASPDASSQVCAEGAATAVRNSAGTAADVASGVTTIHLLDTDKFTAANSDGCFAGGYLVHANGGGGPFRIITNDYTASTSVMKLILEDATTVAFDSEDEVALMANPWNYLQVADSSNMAIAGIPLVTVGASEYGWFQTRGVCSCLADGAITDGMLLTLSDGTAGAVQEIGGGIIFNSETVTTSDLELAAITTEPYVGYGIGATATAKYATIMLQIE